jgi:hypothetical protein
MTAGRVFRCVDGRWQAVGEPLPVWDHLPPRPHQRINVWVLPRGEGYEIGDVVAFGETGHRLLSEVPPDDVAWSEVIDAALAVHPESHVRQWATGIELWLGLRLDDSWRSSLH